MAFVKVMYSRENGLWKLDYTEGDLSDEMKNEIAEELFELNKDEKPQ